MLGRQEIMLAECPGWLISILINVMEVRCLCLSSGSDCCVLSLVGEIGLLSSFVSWSWCLMFVLVILYFF